MSALREPKEILERIGQVEAHLRLIEENFRQEMTKPYFHRRRNFCIFLHLEKKWYGEILKELKWVLNG
ncbi:MAG TPA: hypothetical protein VGQ51_04485 [Puia sp.]|jgi:hypothetical protein|nr:hypothetical protein [Puia sp.]